MDNQDLKYIKKHYGENFAKLCRELFPTLLETPGMLSKIITEKFDSAPTLYEDILPIKYGFKDYIYSFVDVEKHEIIQNKSPEELMDKAGYILFPECKTDGDIQKFIKYYRRGEELCTFRGKRLDLCRVWFAVKKNVNEIKRENFNYPQRQDEYGTSVISIQFTRGKNSTLSIKNRYNHSVNNPDATFGNNLDNIVNGLTEAFCQKYNLHLADGQRKKLMIDNYIQANNGKLFRSNTKFNGTYYCANNVVIDIYRNAKQYDKSKYILVDGYLIDLVDKKISAPDKNDQFVESIGKIQSIKISFNENKNKVITITPKTGEDVQIIVNPSNQIIEYKNSNVKQIGNKFLSGCYNIKSISLPNVEKIGHNFLFLNETLSSIYMPNVKNIESNFLFLNRKLEFLDLPKVEKIGNSFLEKNTILSSVSLPKVKEIGNNFLNDNTELKSISLPNVKKIDEYFLFENKKLKSVSLPNIKKIGAFYLYNNKSVRRKNLRLTLCRIHEKILDMTKN